MTGLPDSDPARELNSSSNIADGQWHHVAMTWNRTSKFLKLFIYGLEKGSRTANSNTFIPSIKVLYIGYWGQSTEHWLEGTIDEVRISNAARTYSGTPSKT